LASDARALWLGAALALLPGLARAGQPNEIDRDAARALVQQGDARAQEGDWQGALEAYRRADDIMGVPTTSIEVGRAALKLGKLVQAKAAFERAARHKPTPGEPAPFTRARSDARRLAKEVAPRIAHLRVSIAGAREGAEIEVAVDEEPVEAWARESPIDPGTHVVVASAEGHEPASETFVLTEGENKELTLRLVPLATAAPPTPDPVAPDSPGVMWPVAITGFSVAGAGVLIGAVCGGISLSEASTVKDRCDDEGACSPEVADALDRSRTLAHVSTASFVVAGVGAAVGIVGLVLALGEDDKDAFRLSPHGVAWAF
jgi:hypothetical protein